jgi:LemA protein
LETIFNTQYTIFLKGGIPGLASRFLPNSYYFLVHSATKIIIMVLWIVIGLIVLLVIWVISLYNTLVRLRNRRENAFADIDVQLRQRHDLVPQLVETVKGYAAHEKELLLRVTEARNAAMAATTIDGKIVAEQQLTSALQGLKVQVEAYPDLKANQNFLQLQEELSDIENKLAASRRFFNAATTEYNNSVESFPGNLIARNFGFNREIMFDLGTETRKQMDEPPKIQF